MTLKTIPTLTEDSLGETKTDNVPAGVVLDKRYYTLAAQYEVLKLSVRALCIDVGADDEPSEGDLKNRVNVLEGGGGGGIGASAISFAPYAAGSIDAVTVQAAIEELAYDVYAALAGKVAAARTITAGTGLTGGGDLSANRTLTVDIAATSPQGVGTSASAGSSGKVSDRDHVHAITATTIIAAMASAAAALAVNAQKITGLATGTANTDGANVGQVSQPQARTVSGTTDTIVAGDIGGVVTYSQAGTVTVAIPDLSGSLISGRAIVLTMQATDAASVLVLDPGASVYIDGVTTNLTCPTGKSRASLISLDGVHYFSGAP